jgi:hypothetical protein
MKRRGARESTAHESKPNESTANEFTGRIADDPMTRLWRRLVRMKSSRYARPSSSLTAQAGRVLRRESDRGMAASWAASRSAFFEVPH